jgi:GTPase involved in cell partitioning and DNA repair
MFFESKISIADLPGIIEGAHLNRGMGHKFLKHLTRTKVNVFIVDINGFELNSKYESRSPFETLVFLNKVLPFLTALVALLTPYVCHT